MATPKNDAVLQIEIDTKRFAKTKEENSFAGDYGDTPWQRIYNIAKTAVCDTIKNGGTFVLTRDGGVITMVQRAGVER
jgi:hypothetical protein